MTSVKFGVMLNSLNTPGELFDLARRTEELGFDSLWAGDHISFHTPLYECLTLLASFASITTRIDHEAARATWIRLLSRRYNQDVTPLAERYGIIGTPAQCAEQLARFVDAGCRALLLNPISLPEDQREQIEAIAAGILSRFQD